MRKNFKAFTLVEMLIVMGIIIILMAVGIASGRFAIRRANRIEHQNAAEQIYQAMQSYYSDNREYPPLVIETVAQTPATLLADGGALDQYVDDFDGGSEAHFYYDVDSTGQVAVICVTLGGEGDANQLGIYCTGNGVGEPAGTLALEIPNKEIPFSEVAGTYDSLVDLMDAGTRSALWDPAVGW